MSPAKRRLASAARRASGASPGLAGPGGLLSGARAALAEAADPARAAKMQAYMKSELPYHGVPMAKVEQVERALFRELSFADASEWERAVLELWEGARFREERYVALALTAHRSARAFQTPTAMPLYERLIVEGAWWDLVDELAHRVGGILRTHPQPMRKLLLKWSQDENLWKRRVAILSQLEFEEATDAAFLYACIEPSLGSKEFFLRKAIGWALRQYAHTNPEEVRRYVREHESRLSPLSKREALKHLDPQRGPKSRTAAREVSSR